MVVDNRGNPCDIARGIDYKDFRGMVYAKFLKVEDLTYYFHYWTVDSNEDSMDGIGWGEKAEVKIVFAEGNTKSYIRMMAPVVRHNKYPEKWIVNDSPPVIEGMIDYVVTRETEKAIFDTETSSKLE